MNEENCIKEEQDVSQKPMHRGPIYCLLHASWSKGQKNQQTYGRRGCACDLFRPYCCIEVPLTILKLTETDGRADRQAKTSKYMHVHPKTRGPDSDVETLGFLESTEISTTGCFEMTLK